jgi:CubicO group peptidase (beta-lactamase class C family)
VFQIGSITKVYTATQVLQLVDGGLVELDATVRTYLPELELSDAEAARRITVRQLLCHTSGLDGDHFPDFGRGDDCVPRFVASCARLAQVLAPGTVFSYCNTGFVLAGALVARVTGAATWDTALQERLLAPLGVHATMTLPEEAILHRAAVGHVDPTGSGQVTPTPVWMLPRAAGRGGIIATASDVISFARLHLDGGRAADGTRVLSEASVQAMQQPQVEVPDPAMAGSWGLGWALYGWGCGAIGHNGGTVGQTAFLRVVPRERYAVAVLTNSTTGPALARELFALLFRERLGVAVPGELEPAADVEFDAAALAGTYGRANVRTVVEHAGGGLAATTEWGGVFEAMMPAPHPEPLVPVAATTFLVAGTPLVFFDFGADGRPRYLHSGGRASARIHEGGAG